jgi:hypothetical protein
MGTNRRKAVKERIARRKKERAKNAISVAQRLMGNSRRRLIGVDSGVGSDSTGTWLCQFHNSKTGQTT